MTQVNVNAIYRLLALLLLVAVARPLPAQETGAPANSAQALARPKTCLVLGGGGARGAAHIGLLQVLEREHVPVDCIVGTSMGAIVGGLYAAGYDAEQIDSILAHIDWKDVFRDKPARQTRSMRRKDDDLHWLGGAEFGLQHGKVALPRGLVQGQKLHLLLRRLLLSTASTQDFDDLPIQFRAIATDVVSGEKVVFSHGDLATAIRASMSVPGAFEPVRVDGRLLVDGGVVDNVPIDEARKLGGQRLIVSQVGSGLVAEQDLTSPLAITQQILTALMARQTQAQIDTLGPQDLLIKPALGKMGSEDFAHAQQAVAIGLAAANDKARLLRRYGVGDAAYAAFEQHHKLQPTDTAAIAFVDVQGAGSRTARYVEKRMAGLVGKPLDVDAVERQINEIYGEGRYQKLQWDLLERDGRQGLAVRPVDKQWGPDFLRFALRVSDDFNGRSNYQLLSELSFTGLNTGGGEARVALGLGEVTRLRGEFFQPFGARGRQSIMPYAEYTATNVALDVEASHQFAQFRRSEVFAGVEWAYSPDNRWRLALGAERGQDRARLRIGDATQLKDSRNDLGGVYGQIEYDTIDSSEFPGHGQRFTLRRDEYLRGFGSDVRADVTRVAWDGAWSRGKNHWLLGAHAGSSRGGEEVLAAYTPLGGLGYFSGYADNEIRATQTALARAIYYRRIGSADTALSVPIYAGASLERGGFWRDRSQASWNSMITAGSVFVGVDSFLGPIFLGYGRAGNGADSFYLTFGSFLRAQDGY